MTGKNKKGVSYSDILKITNVVIRPGLSETPEQELSRLVESYNSSDGKAIDEILIRDMKSLLESISDLKKRCYWLPDIKLKQFNIPEVNSLSLKISSK